MEVKLQTARTLVGRLRGAAAVRDPGATAAAVADIRRASKDDPDVRGPLADAGAVPFLASQLTSTSMSAEDAAAALLNISLSAREQVMSTPGILDALSAAIHSSSSSSPSSSFEDQPNHAAQHAAAAVASLLCVDAYRPIIGAKIPLLSALVTLLRPGSRSTTTRATKDALKALFGVALYPLNRPALVELGCARALFALVVADGRSGIVEDATAVVAQVAGCAESVAAFAAVAGVRILVDLVDGAAATGRARENAASALLNLVMAGGESAVEEVLAVGGAEEAVRELAEDQGASARGKAKAEALLRALEDGAAAGNRRRREHRFADFLDGLVLSDPYFSSPASAATHDG
ncbi:uncharacterized protein LOC100825814 [Brachypodium distachyon]|uniref:U-box domain-containing protein n=1 Tax=Brachypodium distachyon TaxID=15368 RepID=I1HVC5_BRADI|nr:uncharacterized protein LOC100825814 [Brachypodium distachyon]KQK11617.1 hypothetical protein BRADI_2g61220v3 [Brachypodium distachyon]|eukprot:XP_003567494.1 uncharacterized protein LOC100825814 [Brachypodium distachyon]